VPSAVRWLLRSSQHVHNKRCAWGIYVISFLLTGILQLACFRRKLSEAICFRVAVGRRLLQHASMRRQMFGFLLPLSGCSVIGCLLPICGPCVLRVSVFLKRRNIMRLFQSRQSRWLLVCGNVVQNRLVPLHQKGVPVKGTLKLWVPGDTRHSCPLLLSWTRRSEFG
jgi:hypothetical protein